MARGRKPSVRYWPTRKGGGYFCSMAGHQIELALGPDDGPTGPTYLAALTQFAKVIALDHNKGTNGYLVSALMNQYRAYMRETKKAKEIITWEAMCRSFAQKYGAMRVGDLRAFHFDDWLREHPEWNATSKNHAGRLVQVAINWAVKKGYIDSNPVYRKVELPRPNRRGREARLTRELCELLIDSSHSEAFAKFLRALHQTGARPSEILKAEAFNFRRVGECGMLVYRWNTREGYVHKTARRTQKDRIVCLTPELTEVVAALVERYPKGPLFRSPRGKPWGRNNVCEHWRRLLLTEAVTEYCETHGIDRKTLVPYCLRHTFASEWIDTGRSIKVLAELMGTSVRMLEVVYGHPDMDKMHEHYMAFMTKEWASMAIP